MSGNPVYVVAGSDKRTWFYLVPGVGEYNVTWSADGEAMSPVPHTYAKWHSHPGLARALVATGQPRRGELIKWRIKDPGYVSDRFPAELSIEERERDPADGETLDTLYQAVHEELAPRRWVFPASEFVNLGEGDPPPTDDRRTWTADVPYGLEHQPDLHHLFPGRLAGFREHLRKALDAIPGVDAYDTGGFVIYVKLRFDPPELHAVQRGRRASKSESTLTKEVRPSVPHEIRGANRAEACQRWDELTEHWVALFRDFATVRVCGACHGRGVATPKLGQPS